jgi:hypothetical protein
LNSSTIQFIVHRSAFILFFAKLCGKEKRTGQFDARFVLWRRFCAENNIPVETLPSDLTGEAKEKWEKLKNEQLHKPTEEEKP